MAHNLTEADTYTANVSVPDAADARTAASVETPFQALTNRAKYLYTRLTKLAGFYSDGTFHIGAQAAIVVAAEWVWGVPSIGWFSTGNAQVLVVPVGAECLPNGATWTGCTARVNPAIARAGANRMQVLAYKISSVGVWTLIGSGTYDDATTNEQTVTVSGLTEVIDRTAYSYAIRVVSGTGGASGDSFLGAAIVRTL